MHARLGLAVLASLLLATAAFADTYPRQAGVDAVHYVFRLTVVDTSDRIEGDATVTMRLSDEAAREVWLDLASFVDGKGMQVSAVQMGDTPLTFTHASDRLRVSLPPRPPTTRHVDVRITYAGVPAGGLRLINNIHGERTMFSENWPNRARQWLPTIDHPSDKATGEFVVTAPAHYQVVANGLLVEELDLSDDRRRTHWKQSVPIASWLYALGVARFAVHHYDRVRGVAQEEWVFPQDRDTAHRVFEAPGRKSFELFSDWVGPYPYEKLAHVQAAGLGGGTEHASAIFYGEKGVASGRAPVVHEVAHQWWGNAVTERDWDDVWLSEGFATYFTHLYTEHVDGRDAFVRGLRADIATIIKAQAAQPEQAVLHRNLDDMRQVLNRLVYQKGSWVLHMLRGLVGTERFWRGIREYYARYRDGNASTDDLRQVMERAAGTDLTWFFDQWLRRPGMPSLTAEWRYDAAARQVTLTVAQTQPGPAFRFPLDVALHRAGAAPQVQRVDVSAARSTFTFAAEQEPASVALDPDTWLLAQSIDVIKR